MATPAPVVYAPTTPVQSFTEPTRITGLDLVGIETAEYGRLYNVYHVCKFLGLGWNRQRRRLSSGAWGMRFLYRQPGKRSAQMYVSGPTLRGWVISLERTRMGPRTSADTVLAIKEMLGINDQNEQETMAMALTPRVQPADAVSTLDTASETASRTVDTALVTVLQELTAVISVFRADQARDSAEKRYMSQTLADHQRALTEVRAAVAALAGESRTRSGAIDRRLDMTREAVFRTVRQIAGVVHRLNPGVEATTGFDQGCRMFGVTLTDDERREYSRELATWCYTNTRPVQLKTSGGDGHVYNLYVPEDIQAFLVRKGRLANQPSDEFDPSQPSDEFDSSTGGDGVSGV